MKIQNDIKKGLLERVFLTEIARGLRLTLSRLFSKAVTVQYPLERKSLFPGFRGKHAFIRDPDTGGARCVACMRCATVCPSRCIDVKFARDEATGARKLISYEIDALRCIFCGYCEEACPVNAIVLLEEYEYADYMREPFLFDSDRLLRNWDEFALKNKVDARRYLNPFFRPRGVALGELPAAKRIEVPEEWTLEGQVVWQDGRAVPVREAGSK